MCNKPSLLALCLLVACGVVTPAVAQQGNTNRSDALILVQPDGTGLQLSVTFPNQVPHGSVRDRLTKLSRIMGWKFQSIQIQDEKMLSNPDFGPQKQSGVQTGASAFIPGGVYERNGGFILQPYVEAFRDLKRFEVFFFVPPVKNFHGLREFDSPAVYVKLIREGGPYRYYVEMRNPGAAIPAIPLTQAVEVQAPRAPAPPPESHGAGVADFAPVVMIAAGAALLVFFALLLRARMRAPQLHEANQTPASRVTIVRRDR